MRYFSSVALILLVASTCYGDFPKPKSQQIKTPFPAVQVQILEFERPRPLRCWAVRIDMTNPDVELVITPKAKTDPGSEVCSASTLEFAEAEGVQLAINGSPFTPLRAQSGQSMNIEGLHLSRGETVSPSDPRPHYAALLIAGNNRPEIKRYPISPADLAKARHGVGGYHAILCGGKNQITDGNPSGSPPHPRTAVGTSENGKYLWLLVADGRQTGRSEGLLGDELGDWALSLGITDLLNLDGGGSTTFVMEDTMTRKHEVVNSPVGLGIAGTLRQNGNNLGVRIYHSAHDLTASQLRAIMPTLPAERVPLFLGALNRAMTRFHINKPERRAAFLAQLAHESGELKYMEEIADGRAYEGRADLGNTHVGDGPRYKGRGPIQLTGRANYRRAGEALKFDLENEPHRAADPEVGCQIAGWFWETHGLNALADAGNIAEITKRINGGLNGQDRREEYWKKAKETLKVAAQDGTNR